MIPKDARVLVVDDDQEFAKSLVEHLTHLGYKARVAFNGREGLATFRTGAFHIVLTDLHMPEMDGMDLMRQVKNLDNRCVVVVITGFGTVESAVAAVREGAYDFITKPVKFEQLEIVIRRALEKRGLIKQIDFFRGLTLAILISIPIWLVLGIILAWKVF